MIELRHVTKRFGDSATPAVHKVSFKVEPGETMVLLGSSGCGKSTCLKMINRLLEPDEGEILVGGELVAGRDPVKLRRSIGYVIQDGGIFPHWTVRANVGAVLRLRGEAPESRSDREEAMMTMVGLDPAVYADRFPCELSGGQKQRVGVARALAGDPEILLMDEPFGALDGLTRENLQDELLGLKKRLNKTILFVTHDLFEAIKLGDRLAVMHEGRLEQVGTAADLVNRPVTAFVRELFEKPAAQLDAFRSRMQ